MTAHIRKLGPFLAGHTIGFVIGAIYVSVLLTVPGILKAVIGFVQ